MTKIRYLKTPIVDKLRASIRENLPRYRSGDFKDILEDPGNYFEHKTKDINYDAFAGLQLRIKSKSFDVENSLLVYAIMSDLTPFEARDTRMWVYLAHAIGLPYIRNRWKVPANDEKAITYVLDHFFTSSLRSFERSHAISRLWWNARICVRADSKVGLEQTLHHLLDIKKTDIRSNLVERPTTGVNGQLFTAIVAKLEETEDTDFPLSDRMRFRVFMEEINAVGGFMLLDCMSSEDLNKLVTEIYENILKREKVKPANKKNSIARNASNAFVALFGIGR